MSRSCDEMSRSWDALKVALFREGWMDPEASESEADGHALVGERIYVMGYGAGQVKAFVTSRVGASKHKVELEDGPRTETIALRRKGNDKTPFLVRSRMMTEYRRRRDNLTHREPWSKQPARLSRQLSADEANSIWESFDTPGKLDAQQKIHMTASMDARGNLLTRANLLDVGPGESPSLRLASGGSSTEGEDSDRSSPPSPAERVGGGAAPAPRVRLVDTRQRGLPMTCSAPEIRVRVSEPQKVVVASDRHRCKLMRKDWDMLPGMGLYCDYCQRMCRSYGEWFSWNCHGCDFDMCSRCLQESRDAWAIVPPPNEEGSEDPPDVNLSGAWSIAMSGEFLGSSTKQLLGKCMLLHKSRVRTVSSEISSHSFDCLAECMVCIPYSV